MPTIEIYVFEKDEFTEPPLTANLTRVPVRGEFVTFSAEVEPQYEVKIVNHFAFQRPDFVEAEVFVTPADFTKKSKTA